MAKFIKCKWTRTAAGGGVSIQGFKAYDEEERVDPQTGRTIFYRSKFPKDVTINVNDGKKEEHKETGTILGYGDFMVQDIKENREELKSFLSRGYVRLDDWDLMEQLTGEDMGSRYENVETGEEMVALDTTPKGSIAHKKVIKQTRENNLKKAREKILKDRKADSDE